MPQVADAAALARHLGVDARDAEVLLAKALGKSRAWVLAHPEASVPVRTAHRVTKELQRRAEGYPLAYATGVQDFAGRTFSVTPAVLIPRQETELLVELAIDKTPPTAEWTVADIGTGSGCIAITFALARPRCRVLATDRSVSALTVARRNAHRLAGTKRIRFRRGSLLTPLGSTRVDVLIANLPYLPDGPLPTGEPKMALAGGGNDGTRTLLRFLRQVQHLPYKPRWVLLEIDPRNVRTLKRSIPQGYAGHFHRDLAGRMRILELTPTA